MKSHKENKNIQKLYLKTILSEVQLISLFFILEILRAKKSLKSF